ncbi:hypothetical protein K491DRAFT_441577 [Lophiostoma macrostomum CBS 122681]|uniref:Uncharacterized protein n=1 Tax=Lophiostoma macrostomum CBS 122681 TaxID=1314788 RepID=A0A6A6T7S0_9PLEO|nr:hypothetical protein K491DRAFT_441577 [Lophiostoma macrostomum CBS 122681]
MYHRGSYEPHLRRTMGVQHVFRVTRLRTPPRPPPSSHLPIPAKPTPEAHNLANNPASRLICYLRIHIHQALSQYAIPLISLPSGLWEPHWGRGFVLAHI